MSPVRFTNKLAGQRVLLVGGTGGVGISIAQALLEYGAFVTLSSSRETKVKDVCAALVKDYPEAKDRVSGFACDLASPNVESNIEELFKKVGEINHAIYIAGDRLPTIPLEAVTLEKWQKCNRVRTIAAIRTDAHPLSCPGGLSLRNQLLLAFDLAPIRVNAVAPGVIETDLWQGLGEEGRKAFFADHQSKIPTGKVGQPEDLAEAYLYCLKDLNATGIVVHSTFLK
ncbi:uncharacterized protein Z518_01003 [Rhinocladiella mackenziei CBS 650.93]|uniref:Ketoreductase (KR) domain-containing protein n=1 Tax=Rhinocladiella mackenziei CBS 650.93 TaxID=1442369 RepID=A0A0D2G579_9EURO|nr:uncharacterized protein Z518_01003 [Rhinocladiella mackenziei CBS 650.93]KIX09922.1 hypothetical protein Z518_01003 [Rhinocladiella mackenziei CBS 650.93]